MRESRNRIFSSWSTQEISPCCSPARRDLLHREACRPQLNSDFSLFQIVLVYNSSEEQLNATAGAALHWPGGVVPPDVPVCGFKNDNPACLTSQ